MKNQAVAKIEAELKAFRGGNKETAVKSAVADTLKEFALQDGEFAQAIVQNDKTLSDCCTAVMKGVGTSISDHEAYRRAVRFYFPGADVRFQMVVDLCPRAGDEKAAAPGQQAVILDLADFFK